MSTLEATNPFAVPAEAAADTWWARLDRAMSRLSEHFNPILVKEARQALKSKQFSITFTLLLFCGWAWSIFAVALLGDQLTYGAEGRTMFTGYFVILAFPMLVIVPVSAFRSLAGECEDGTFELLSVTTLGAWQIISGKLGSAVLQMIVYLSAMAPCLAFTYLLRGIELPAILLVILYVFLASLGLSLIGLLLATVTQEKHWQVLLLVFLIVALLITCLMGCMFVAEILWLQSGFFDDPDFWVANAVVLTIYVGYFALFYCLAAGRLTFASENRSTPPRIVLLAQQAMLFGWMAWAFLQEPASEWWLAFVTVSTLHWYVMGMFLVAEDPDLSPRVQRRLPKSFLGRLFFTWFNPGPGSGYTFVLANLAAAMLLGAACLSAYQLFVPGGARFGLRQDWETLAMFGLLAYCYLAMYLGLGRLLLVWARRRYVVGAMLSLLLQALLMLLGSAVPFTWHLFIEKWRWEYNLMELTNPFWTLFATIDGLAEDPWLKVDQSTVLLLTLPPLAAVIVFANLRGIVEEIRKTRVAAPARVLEEDASRQTRAQPAGPVQISPWDYEAPAT